MLRRAFSTAAMAGFLALAALTPARGDEDMRTASSFARGLRERGLYDLATDYLEQLRTEKATPDEIRQTIDYEQGLILLDEASHSADLVRRKEMLEEARGKLTSFTEKYPNHPLAPEALVQRARLLVERGHLAVLFGEEAATKAEKDAKLVEARRSFDEARTAYEAAEVKLEKAFKSYPPFIPEGDPRRAERDRAHISLMDSQLQKAVVDYEEGQTYDAKSKERADYLAKGLSQFEELYKKYRTQFAGLTARMWQAKCYEENGDIGKAMGIYNELLDHSDPRLRGLQRHVAYFKIIALAKRKEFALAADEADRWLKRYTALEEKRSNEGIGVQFELAKNILAQMPSLDEKDKERAKRRGADILGEVVRFSSPYKSEALKLYKELRPNSLISVDVVTKLNFEDAMSQADQAIAGHEWDKAIALLKQAVRKADPGKDPEKAILPRYNMAFCFFMNKQYYESAVICEHLARRYRNAPLGSKATEIGMASYAEAYNSYTGFDRGADLKNLIDLAEYTAATWPATEQGDLARMTLGQIYHGTGQYPKAIAVYEAVRQKSSKWIDAQSRVGTTHWMNSLVIRQKGDAKAADAEVEKAIAALKASYKGRIDGGATLTDPGVITNACEIADVYLDTGRPKEALETLTPVVKAQPAGSTGQLYGRLIAAMLRGHISDGQVDLALADMATLEKSGASGSMTQLYFTLGRLLEKEMDKFREKNDMAGLSRMQQAYQKFLGALVASKSGQTYESLEWAGENMLKLNHSQEAAEVFRRILETYGKDEKFLAQGGSRDSLLRTKLKLSQALRNQRDFTAAEAVVTELLRDYPKTIETMFEEGHLLEAKAMAGRGKWSESHAKWRAIALLLAKSRQRPIEYYDAWYHAALANSKDNRPTEALKELRSVMTLSPKVGNPEMKTKYQDLIKQIGGKQASR